MVRVLRSMEPTRWYYARVNYFLGALSLREAARTMGISPAKLSDIEHGRMKPTKRERNMMRALYGGEAA